MGTPIKASAVLGLSFLIVVVALMVVYLNA